MMLGRHLGAQSLQRNAIVLLGAILSLGLVSTTALGGDFTVTGRFLYEDLLYDKDGYTGAVQNLPIRHADVEVVKSPEELERLADGGVAG